MTAPASKYRIEILHNHEVVEAWEFTNRRKAWATFTEMKKTPRPYGHLLQYVDLVARDRRLANEAKRGLAV